VYMKKLLWHNRVVVLVAGLMLMVLSAVLTGCQTASSDSIRFTAVEGEETFGGLPMGSGAGESAVLAKGDRVKVVFSGLQEPPLPHEEQIKEDGNITLPYIGAVKAEGKTTAELQKEIHDKYVPTHYKHLTITVSTDRRVYYVQGQVRASGRQEYLGTTTVLKAIATAGDFTDFANRKRVVLTRADGSRIIVDCVKAAKDSNYDLPVFPGDKIEVPMRGPGSLFD
jgi:protein involved in polysaccharide export with SLBB domain